MTVLNNEHIRGLVGESNNLIILPTQMRQVHGLETRRSFEQKCARQPPSTYSKMRRIVVRGLAPPILPSAVTQNFGKAVLNGRPAAGRSDGADDFQWLMPKIEKREKLPVGRSTKSRSRANSDFSDVW